MKEVTNEQPKVRDSNIELLRIVSMFMILLVHANFFALGEPSSQDIISNPVDATVRVVFEAACITCVDIFVLISGWFGIRPKVKSLCGFIFQCLFFLFGSYLIAIIWGYSKLSVNGVVGCFAGTHVNWFIKAYLFLYVLSPVLNIFVEYSPRPLFRNTLIGFFVLQSIYGWIFPSSTAYIEMGYSPLSFIGLYLLARYTHIYNPTFANMSRRCDSVIVSIITLCVSIIYCCPPLFWNVDTTPLICNRFINYIAPTTILSAIYTLLLFSKMNIHNKFVNWVGSSCFAVYLIHGNPCSQEPFKNFFRMLHSNNSVIDYWLLTFVCLILVFFIAIMIDKLRLFIWKQIC